MSFDSAYNFFSGSSNYLVLILHLIFILTSLVALSAFFFFFVSHVNNLRTENKHVRHFSK